MATIYFDEAGNTGANLLDPEQPVFVLASNDFSDEEANSLLEHVRSGQGNEAKFSNLRRRPEGVARIIRLLADPRMNRDRIRVCVFHKRYMVVTKMVDLIAENVIRHIGGDLYERGANIAMANYLYYCMPAFCDEPTTDGLLQRFVELIRHGSSDLKDAFYRAGEDLLRACSNDAFKDDLIYFTQPELFHIWYHDFDWSDLDPAIPALFYLVVDWGRRKSDRFHILHDRSKPILATQQTFESMMAGLGEESRVIGTDRRTITFPLRALTLSQGDSTQHPQLQLADICAGAVNHFYKLHIKDQTDDLAEAVESLGCLDWGSNFVLPQPEVTPEALGTASIDGTNSVDVIAEYIDTRGARKP